MVHHDGDMQLWSAVLACAVLTKLPFCAYDGFQ